MIESLRDRLDVLLIGGGMANTFLKAKGIDVQESLVEEDSIHTARHLIEKLGDMLVLPVDVVAAETLSGDAQRRTVSVDQVPGGWKILDVGPETIALFRQKLQGAKTVIWNGPMGVFEISPFDRSTNEMAKVLAELDAETIVGGGDSAAAVNRSGVADRLSHVSTGGGAFLEFLEGKTLPGIAALQDR